MTLALVTALCVTAAPGFGPFGAPGHPVTRDARFRANGAPASGATFFQLSYDFYRRVVSPIDGPICKHRPTCSRYALLAVQRHGVVGMLLTIDRLLRTDASSALRSLPLLQEGQRWIFLDPLEESTFWFSPSASPSAR